MKTRKPLRRISKKKQAQLDAGGVRVFSTVPRSKAKAKRKPKAERDEKFAREFGSAERVDWINSLPCSACNSIMVERQNHHVSGHAMGKRAHHSVIIPLCVNCHREWHQRGRHTFCDKHQLDAAVQAERVAKAWFVYSTGQPWHEATGCDS